MSAESQDKSKQSMKSIEVSSAKNNSLLLFFNIFSLYIFISVLNTTDLMLLLPTHTFKMPFIGFDLNLIFFYVLAPLLLLLLHFNILFNYYVHLKKLNAYKDQIELENIDPSVYSYAYVLVNRGFAKGTVISVILWLLIYLFPLLVLISIYQRFADYHHTFITALHLAIVFLDIILICCSIVYNRAYLKHSQNSTTLISYLFIVLVIFIGLAEAAYFGAFYYPLTYDDIYDSKLMEPYNKGEAGWFPSLVCKIHHPFLTHGKNASIDCFPRLVVTEEEMAKISSAALYIPRYLAMEGATEKTDKEKADKEKKLILNYGTRIDLTNRNLRYANLEKCILTRANMQHSKLDAANLKGSHLQAVDLSDAELQDANLQEAKLQSATLIGTQLQDASFVGANMQETQLWHSNLSNSNLQKVQLQQAKFNGVDLGNADLRAAKLNNASFIGSNLTGASLHGANITSAAFDKANLTAADLSNALFVKGVRTTAIFKEAEMFGVNISKNIILDGNLTACQKQYIFDGNVSKNILTFDGRRVKYLHTAIQQIDAQKPMANCKSQETKKKLTEQLQKLLNTSCTKLETEVTIYKVTKDIENIYNELITICNH